jgi:hypothetical protein
VVTLNGRRPHPESRLLTPPPSPPRSRSAADVGAWRWRFGAVVAAAALIGAITVGVGHLADRHQPQDREGALANTQAATAVQMSAAPTMVRHGVTTDAGRVYAHVSVAFLLFGLIGPSRRRVCDVGDRWRRLLLGAPPAGHPPLL